jgi:hypothetical protein
MSEPNFLIRDLSYPQIEFRSATNESKILFADTSGATVNHISLNTNGGLLLGNDVAVNSNSLDVTGSVNISEDLAVNGSAIFQGPSTLLTGEDASGALLFVNNSNNSYAIYHSSTQSIDGSTSVNGHDFSGSSMCIRVPNDTTKGLVLENDTNELLASVNGASGRMYLSGDMVVNGTTKLQGNSVFTTAEGQFHVRSADANINLITTDNSSTNGPSFSIENQDGTPNWSIKRVPDTLPADSSLYFKGGTASMPDVMSLTHDNMTVYQNLIAKKNISVDGYLENKGTGVFVLGEDGSLRTRGISYSNDVIYEDISGSAPAGYDFTGTAIRNRKVDSANQGFVWENSTNKLLMSLNANTGRLSVTDQVLAGDGTVSRPGFAFESRSNVGIWSEATKGLSLSSGNAAEAMSMNNQNQITMNGPLSFSGYDSISGPTGSMDFTTDDYLIMQANSKLVLNSPDTRVLGALYTSADALSKRNVLDDGLGNSTILNNLGVGTYSPSSKFHLSGGDLRVTSGDILLASGPNGLRSTSSAGVMMEGNNGNLKFQNGALPDNYWTIFGGPDGNNTLIQVYQDGRFLANDITLNDSLGNMGLGIANPEGKLHVKNSGNTFGTIIDTNSSDILKMERSSTFEELVTHSLKTGATVNDNAYVQELIRPSTSLSAKLEMRLLADNTAQMEFFGDLVSKSYTFNDQVGETMELGANGNRSTGVSLRRITTDPANQHTLFSVEGVTSENLFGVSLGNGAFVRDNLYVGKIFDADTDIPVPTHDLYISGTAKIEENLDMDQNITFRNTDMVMGGTNTNRSTGVSVKTLSSVGSLNTLFNVESADSKNHFGVTEGNGAFVKDSLRVGYDFDGDVDIPSLPNNILLDVNGNAQISGNIIQEDIVSRSIPGSGQYLIICPYDAGSKVIGSVYAGSDLNYTATHNDIVYTADSGQKGASLTSHTTLKMEMVAVTYNSVQYLAIKQIDLTKDLPTQTYFQGFYRPTTDGIFYVNAGDITAEVSVPTTIQTLDIQNTSTNISKGKFQVIDDSTQDIRLFVDSQSPSVGINTQTPTHNLHVEGTLYASGNATIGNNLKVNGDTIGLGSIDILRWLKPTNVNQRAALYFNGSVDNNWVLYMADSGHSTSGGSSPQGFDFTSYAIRLRCNNLSSHGIIFENSAEERLLSVRGDDASTRIEGPLSIKGNITIGGNDLYLSDVSGNPNKVMSWMQKSNDNKRLEFYMNGLIDNNWGFYMANSGTGNSLDNGNSVEGYDFNDFAIRFRCYKANRNGFIFENSEEERLFSIRATDASTRIEGPLSIKGNMTIDNTEIYLGKIFGKPNLVLKTLYETNNQQRTALYLNNGQDNNWGMYMAVAGPVNSLDQGDAVPGYDFNGWAQRIRFNGDPDQGLIFENAAEQRMMSIRGSDASTSIEGPLRAKATTIDGNLSVNGDATIAGQISQSSDSRLKENVLSLSDSLKTVMKMRGRTFKRTMYDHKTPVPDKFKDKIHIGFIAQELLDAVPEAVSQDDTSGYYRVDYGCLTAVLADAIKEMHQKHEQEISDLKGELKDIRILLEKLI